MRLLERPPSRVLKVAFRLPLLLYRLRLGRLLGRRFCVIVHRGRRSGRLYRTVVEVVRYDAARREAIVASGWGERSQWYRNLRAASAVEVWLGAERFVPEQRFLDLEERTRVLEEYAREHRLAASVIGRALGIEGGADAMGTAAERLPMVAFRPA